MPKNFDKIIGNTPIQELYRLENGAVLLGKLESYNPAGSVKDRPALEMILQAKAQGDLKEGGVIIEPTSGNTGIGLAWVASKLGYKVILTMPETMSKERRELLASYGAKVVLTSGERGMQGAIEKANELALTTENSFVPKQFENPANPLAHYKTTAPEIWEQTGGRIDGFVCGIGTGGTISGVGRYLKEKNAEIEIIGVEPENSAVLSGKKAGPHELQGIGAGFVPKALELAVVDKVLTATFDDAKAECKALAQEKGIFVGISSGAAVAVAKKYASLEENKGKTFLVLCPDGKDRYISMNLYE